MKKTNKTALVLIAIILNTLACTESAQRVPQQEEGETCPGVSDELCERGREVVKRWAESDALISLEAAIEAVERQDEKDRIQRAIDEWRMEMLPQRLSWEFSKIRHFLQEKEVLEFEERLLAVKTLKDYDVFEWEKISFDMGVALSKSRDRICMDKLGNCDESNPELVPLDETSTVVFDTFDLYNQILWEWNPKWGPETEKVARLEKAMLQ